ncbi:MAG: hypothetical protein Q8P63_00250 [Candidatus Nealsonbacteria bacterium]|nr:hypothetical protein [Candidatus Nealsonbacteria bacterium]
MDIKTEKLLQNFKSKSGDSDLLELKNYVLNDKRKNIIFWAFEKNMAWELKYCWHLYLDDFKDEILRKFEFKK